MVPGNGAWGKEGKPAASGCKIGGPLVLMLESFPSGRDSKSGIFVCRPFLFCNLLPGVEMYCPVGFYDLPHFAKCFLHFSHEAFPVFQEHFLARLLIVMLDD